MHKNAQNIFIIFIYFALRCTTQGECKCESNYDCKCKCILLRVFTQRLTNLSLPALTFTLPPTSTPTPTLISATTALAPLGNRAELQWAKPSRAETRPSHVWPCGGIHLLAKVLAKTKHWVSSLCVCVYVCVYWKEKCCRAVLVFVSAAAVVVAFCLMVFAMCRWHSFYIVYEHSSSQWGVQAVSGVWGARGISECALSNRKQSQF